jgi:hypothetical protein
MGPHRVGLVVHDGRTVAFRHELARQVIGTSIHAPGAPGFIAASAPAGRGRNADAAIWRTTPSRPAMRCGARFAPLAAQGRRRWPRQEAVAHERPCGSQVDCRPDRCAARRVRRELLVVNRSLDAG